MAKADPNQKLDYGLTALHATVQYGNTEAAKMLMRAGADVLAEDDDGETPLDLARERGKDVMAEVLIKFARGRVLEVDKLVFDLVKCVSSDDTKCDSILSAMSNI
eukprot:UC4_evm1s948